MSKAYIVTGLGFGDEGKGRMVDYLCSTLPIKAVVRHNGGDQAGHNVVTSTGRHHCFSQIGAGAFHGTITILTHTMFWNPISLVEEAIAFGAKEMTGAMEVLSNIYIHEHAPVITPYHVAANRIREYCRIAKHGTCGRGIGELASCIECGDREILKAGDLVNPATTIQKLQDCRDFYLSQLHLELSRLRSTELIDQNIRRMVALLDNEKSPIETAKAYYEIQKNLQVVSATSIISFLQANDVVFEGAQGVLLDQVNGFHPHTTWSNCVPRNISGYLKYFEKTTHIGVIRAYSSRHGEGPFVTQDDTLSDIYTSEHNQLNRWQGDFKRGWFDLVMLKYALDACAKAGTPVDKIALTHVDVFKNRKMKYAHSYLLPLDIKPGCLLESVEVEKAQRGLSLVPSCAFDVVYQENLSKLLEVAIPEYTTLDIPEELCSVIEEETGTPIGWISKGAKTHQVEKIQTSYMLCN